MSNVAATYPLHRLGSGHFATIFCHFETCERSHDRRRVRLGPPHPCFARWRGFLLSRPSQTKETLIFAAVGDAALGRLLNGDGASASGLALQGKVVSMLIPQAGDVRHGSVLLAPSDVSGWYGIKTHWLIDPSYSGGSLCEPNGSVSQRLWLRSERLASVQTSSPRGRLPIRSEGGGSNRRAPMSRNLVAMDSRSTGPHSRST